MNGDNRVLNINGELERNKPNTMLEMALKLALMQQGDPSRPATCVAWRFAPDYGLILYWTVPDHSLKDIQKFPMKMTVKQLLPFVEGWLEGEFETLRQEGKMQTVLRRPAMPEDEKYPETWEYDNAKEHWCTWDEDPQDDDVSTAPGWRVYCEPWGHVDDDWAAICAVKPVFMWYGK